MVNDSQKQQSHMWAKWRAAGAVRNTQTPTSVFDQYFGQPNKQNGHKAEKGSSCFRREFPKGTLNVAGICTHHAGQAKGYSTISLGEREISRGNGWSSTEPLCWVLVPTTDPDISLGTVLPAIPADALPVSAFFPKAA